MSLLRRQKLTILGLAIYWPVLFYVAHIPIPQVVRDAHVSDKSLHLLAYMILVFLLWSAIWPNRKVSLRKAAPWWVLLGIVVYGVIDEGLQCYTGRTPDAYDFLADLGGAGIALGLLWVFSFWPAALLVTAGTLLTMSVSTGANLMDLLPVTDTVCQFLAYAFFTILWTRYLALAHALGPVRRKCWLPAIAIPAALVVLVKGAAVLSGKAFDARDAISSAAGVAAILIGSVIFKGVGGRGSEAKGQVRGLN